VDTKTGGNPAHVPTIRTPLYALKTSVKYILFQSDRQHDIFKVLLGGHNMDHYFTEEELIELRANPFTQSVHGRTLKFTEEFNDLFLARHSQGVPPTIIFKDCGYRVEVIGKIRIANYYNRLKSTLHYAQKKETEFFKREQVKTDYQSLPPLQAIDAMQNEITYLRQEIEFLKKIIALANKKKQDD